ncbi:MAG: ABC transporter substrate-binding protein [Ilumatobacteraceae bacterium]|nr:ABC transporter substrate-binding protein [Ilumatobacteraceae bacterium]
MLHILKSIGQQLMGGNRVLTGTRKRGVAGLVALVGVFALAAAACSSDSDESGESKPASTESASSETASSEPASSEPASSDPGSTEGTTLEPVDTDPAPTGPVPASGQGIDDERVLIGVSIDKSGPFGPVSAELEAALTARFEVANAEGGANGRQIETIILDDKADPTQALENFRQLWERDKVFAIYTLGTNAPLEYIQANDIPTFAFAGPIESFSSAYPTILPLGSLTPAWTAQTAFSVVEYGGLAPKTVAVLYDPINEPLNDFVEDYWMQLGAEEVIFDPPPADCSALVLKYQEAEVDYWEWQSIAFLGCLAAEDTIGWQPSMGQGGPIASQIAIARLVPDQMIGVVAGSPNRLADGRPTFDEPTEAHQAYLDGMEEFAPKIFADEAALNGTIPMLIWVGGSFIIDAIEGAAVDSGEISQESALDWAWNIEDWDTGIAGVIHSAAPDCKTGNDATIWGNWIENPDPDGDLILEPYTPDLIDNEWLGVDPCYLTQFADELTG